MLWSCDRIQRSSAEEGFMVKTTNNNIKGPSSYENWKLYLNNAPVKETSEYPLFSDARVTGENIEDYKPYYFFNAVPLEDKPGLVQAVLYLRIEACGEFEKPDMSMTDSERYHVGTPIDEIAALSSLALGIRLKAGGMTRHFDINGDPRGRPVEWGTKPKPFVLIESRGLKLPFVVSETSTERLRPLSILPKLSASDAIPLIRVARLYQDALWLAESEPSLAWIMLVSAIETAANRWRKSEDTPIERLKASKSDLVKLLDSCCKKGTSSKVAKLIIDSIGNTKKFKEFIMEFLPGPPNKRPEEWAQISWDKKDIKKAMVIIYKYRSLALHEGKPFPAPMCLSSSRDSSGKVYLEKPFGSAMSMMGGTWKAEDCPMLLHTFEYIVRNALLKWWKTLDTK